MTTSVVREVAINSGRLAALLTAGSVLVVVGGVGCVEEPQFKGVDAASRDTASAGGSDGSSSHMDSGVVDTAVSEPVAVAEELIDDLEDCDEKLPMVNGRDSTWYVYRDPATTMTPEPWIATPDGGAPTSTTCYSHVSGNRAMAGYCGFGVGLSGTMPSVPYDASAYRGITFWIKGSGMVTFRVLTSATAPPEGGGTCKPTGQNGACWDGHGADITLTPQWTRYSFAWTALEQTGWGLLAAFDPSKILDFQWQPGPGPFDVSLDQLSFVTAF